MEFNCRYAKSTGEVVREVLVGQTAEEVRHRLKERDLLPLAVSPKALSWPFRRRRKNKSFTAEDFIVFNQQFVALIRSGLPIVRSLDLLKGRITNPDLQIHIESVREKVVSGTSLSLAMEEEHAFPPVYTASVLAGERSGSIEEVITRFIHYEKTMLTARKKFRNSLIYPGFLIVLSTVMVGVIMAYVIPQFSELYEGMSTTLPVPTQVLIAVAESIRGSLLLTLSLLVGGLITFRFWVSSAGGRNWFDNLKLRLPIIGNIWLMLGIAQLSRTLSTLLKGGIPLIVALDVAQEASGNRVIADAIAAGRVSVKEGLSLAAGLESTGRFPDLALEMVRIGEQTGALPDMLNHVADFYDEDVDMRLSALLSWAEPLILIFVAVLVAAILISLYLPIFSIGSRGLPA